MVKFHVGFMLNNESIAVKAGEALARGYGHDVAVIEVIIPDTLNGPGEAHPVAFFGRETLGAEPVADFETANDNPY